MHTQKGNKQNIGKTKQRKIKEQHNKGNKQE